MALWTSVVCFSSKLSMAQSVLDNKIAPSACKDSLVTIQGWCDHRLVLCRSVICS